MNISLSVPALVPLGLCLTFIYSSIKGEFIEDVQAIDFEDSSDIFGVCVCASSSHFIWLELLLLMW